MTLVDRPRLRDRIVAMEGARRVGAVTAGAGSGKTVLMAACANQLEHVAWVTIDAYDNDPQILWSAVLDALARSGAWADDGALHDLLPASGPMESEFFGTVVNAFEHLTAPIWLFLDDVHELIRPTALDSLDLLVRNLPDRLRIVMGARHDPPSAVLSRLRLDGAIVELRDRDLAFARAEAATLLAGHGVTLCEPDLDLLLDKTEGWAAGLRLAAISLDSAEDPHALLLHFSGDDRAVGDYLVQTVLGQLEEGVRRFLLHTSVCTEVTPALAVRMTGRGDAGAVLENLARHHALTVRAQQTALPWYRYHTLLRGYLCAELDRTESALVPTLHAAAADWHAEAGDPSKAIQHAIESRDDGRIADTIRQFGLGLVLSGRAEHVRGVADALPPDARSLPVNQLTFAAAALDGGDLTSADRHLCDDPPPDGDAHMLLLWQALQLWRARLDDRLERATEALAAPGVDAMPIIGDGDVEPAAEHIRLASASHSRRFEIQLGVFIQCQVQLIAVDGDGDQRSALKVLRDIWRQPNTRHAVAPLVASMCVAEMRMCLALGEADWAGETIRRTQEYIGDVGEVTLLRALLSAQRGRVDAARALLQPVVSELQACASPLGLIEALVLDAVLASDQGRDMHAHAGLSRVAAMAEPRGAARPFVAAGEPVRALIVRGLGRWGLVEGFLLRVLDSFPDAGQQEDWRDNLTPAEPAVLTDLPAIMTLREIADARHLSVNTVKTHLRGVYQKLGVNNRRDAVLQARLRRLI